MLHTPMDVLTRFPVRKTKQQKEVFRTAMQAYAQNLGYAVSVEEGSFGARNIVIGDPEKARFLVTAHYDTCARMIVPNWITPCNLWSFLGYQLLLTALILGAGFGISFLVGLALGQDLNPMLGFAAFLGIQLLMRFGPANCSNANDNTSGVITVLEIARTLPENQRCKVCFVLFDLEEAGLIGSASYRKGHITATGRQLVLNLDCVGDGDHIRMFPTKALKNDRKQLTSLYRACGYFGKKDILVHEKGFSVYPSDQNRFPLGVGICALGKSRFGLSMGRIHTPKDTVLDQTNVNILRAALTTFITCDS